MKNTLFIIIAIVLAFGFIGCDDGTIPEPVVTDVEIVDYPPTVTDSLSVDVDYEVTYDNGDVDSYTETVTVADYGDGQAVTVTFDGVESDPVYIDFVELPNGLYLTEVEITDGPENGDVENLGLSNYTIVDIDYTYYTINFVSDEWSVTEYTKGTNTSVQRTLIDEFEVGDILENDGTFVNAEVGDDIEVIDIVDYSATDEYVIYTYTNEYSEQSLNSGNFTMDSLVEVMTSEDFTVTSITEYTYSNNIVTISSITEMTVSENGETIMTSSPDCLFAGTYTE